MCVYAFTCVVCVKMFWGVSLTCISATSSAQIIVFDVEIPITKGFSTVCHIAQRSDPAVISKLISQVDKVTNEVVKQKPRCLTKNMSAVVEISFERPFCVELYKYVFFLRSTFFFLFFCFFVFFVMILVPR